MNPPPRLCLALLCAIPLVLTCGCAQFSAAHRLETAPVKKITAGTSTRNTVERVFGKPEETIVAPGGNMVAHYIFATFQTSRDASRYRRRENPGDILLRTLSVLYDREGVVRAKLHDESLTPARRHHDVVEAGVQVSQAILDTIRPGTTTADTVIARLGEPTVRLLETDGKIALGWFYDRRRLDNFGKPDRRAFWVVLDDDRRVKDFRAVERTTRWMP